MTMMMMMTRLVWIASNRVENDENNEVDDAYNDDDIDDDNDKNSLDSVYANKVVDGNDDDYK